MAGNVVVGTIFNVSTGVPNEDDMMQIDYLHTGPPTRVYAIVDDAAATNAINTAVSRVP